LLELKNQYVLSLRWGSNDSESLACSVLAAYTGVMVWLCVIVLEPVSKHYTFCKMIHRLFNFARHIFIFQFFVSF